MFKHGAEIFNNDSALTSALLDRLLHHAETVLIEGKSYRMKDQIDNPKASSLRICHLACQVAWGGLLAPNTPSPRQSRSLECFLDLLAAGHIPDVFGHASVAPSRLHSQGNYRSMKKIHWHFQVAEFMAVPRRRAQLITLVSFKRA